MPVGFAFKVLGMRVGHCGPKLAELIVSSPGPAFLVAQHLIIGWLSTLPLLFLMRRHSIWMNTALAIAARWAKGVVGFMVHHLFDDLQMRL